MHPPPPSPTLRLQASNPLMLPPLTPPSNLAALRLRPLAADAGAPDSPRTPPTARIPTPTCPGAPVVPPMLGAA